MSGIVPCFDPSTGVSGGAVSGGGAAQVLTVLDVNWPQLWIDNGSSNVDLSSSGTYTLAGTSFTVDQNHNGITATLKSTGLHIEQVAGSSFDWSIALTADKSSAIADYVVLTADITATVSSRTSGNNSNGVYAVGYTNSPTWGTTPGNNALGGGVRIASNSRSCAPPSFGTSQPRVGPTASRQRLCHRRSTTGGTPQARTTSRPRMLRHLAPPRWCRAARSR